MFKNELKTITPCAIGMAAGLITVAIFDSQAAVKAIIPVAAGLLAGFIAALYMAKKGK